MPPRYAVTINRPIAKVFQFLAEPAQLARWDPSVRRAWWSSPVPLGLGTTFGLELECDGRVALARGEVVAFEPPARLALVWEIGCGRVITRLELEAAAHAAATRLTLRRQTIGADGWSQVSSGDIEAGLRRLQIILEGESDVPA